MGPNPDEINERIAADVFWTYVFEHGFAETIASITDADNVPHEMWSYERAQKAMSTYFDDDLDTPDDIRETTLQVLYEQVLSVILIHVREEKNIIGPIYVEDFKDCREANFKYAHLLEVLSQDSDENCDYEVTAEGDFTCTGTLLLRTPLPSGVLLKGELFPFQGPIIVENTEKALGFYKTLVFFPDGVAKLPANPQHYDYFISGYFQVPTTGDIDLPWHKILPNATGVLKGSKVLNPDNTYSSFSIQKKGEGGMWRKFKNQLWGT